MAHITDINYVLDRITDGEFKNFTIFNSDGKSVIDEDRTGDLTPAGVRDRVSRTLSNLTGNVIVELSDKSRDERAKGGAQNRNLRISVNLGTSPKAVQGIGSPGNDLAIGALQQNFQNQIDALKMGFDYQNQINDLKRQLEEAKEGNPITRMIEPHIGKIIDIFTGAPQQKIAGPGHGIDTENEMISLDDDQEKQAEDYLRRLIAVDPEFLDVLRRLATMAETNKAMYDMAKNMLPK